MENKRNIITMLVFLAFAAGCSTAGNAPFHIYNSPLLNAQNHPSERKSREYDPFDGTGDHVEPRQVYAVTDVSGKTQQVQAQPQAEPAKGAKTPTLSSYGATAVGGTESADLKDIKSIASGYTPDHAAEYAWEVLNVNGVTLANDGRNSIPKLYKSCKKVGKVSHDAKPHVGDLVFFHNVLDANTDGRNNDWYTHVAVVEAVDSDSTVTAIGYTNSGMTKLRLNLEQPDATGSGPTAMNSRLRDASGKDAPFTQYFASQLFAGYCSALGDQPQFVAVDNWRPGAKVSR